MWHEICLFPLTTSKVYFFNQILFIILMEVQQNPSVQTYPITFFAFCLLIPFHLDFHYLSGLLTAPLFSSSFRSLTAAGMTFLTYSSDSVLFLLRNLYKLFLLSNIKSKLYSSDFISTGWELKMAEQHEFPELVLSLKFSQIRTKPFWIPTKLTWGLTQ